MFIFEEEVYPRNFQDQVSNYKFSCECHLQSDALIENANVGTRFDVNTTTN